MIGPLQSGDRLIGRSGEVSHGAVWLTGAGPLVGFVLLLQMHKLAGVKSLTVRLPESLVADIEAESRRRKISKSDVVRELLERTSRRGPGPTASLDAISDLVGSVAGLPSDLSMHRKVYLRTTGYGKKRHR